MSGQLNPYCCVRFKDLSCRQSRSKIRMHRTCGLILDVQLSDKEISSLPPPPTSSAARKKKFEVAAVDFLPSALKLFTKRQLLRLVQIQSICRRQNKCKLQTEILFWMGRKHCGKSRKCCLPAFSSFPTMFLKGFFFPGC